MKAENAMEQMNRLIKDDVKRRQGYRTMSDYEFCGAMLSFLEENLDEEDKTLGHGELGMSYYDIKHAYEHDENPNVEDMLLYFRQVFYYDVLVFCGCGCPSEAIDFVLYFLNCFIDEQWKETILLDLFSLKECLKGLKGFDDESGIPCVVEFMLHYLDKLGLSEHGSSVYGSWLTDAGIMWREVLRRTEGVDI